MRKAPRKSVPKILIIILFIIGTVSVLLSLLFAFSTISILNDGIETTGTVIKLRSLTRGSSAPVVEFKTKDGKTFTYNSSTKFIFETFKIGDEVSIIYNPKNPQNAQINTFFGNWGAPILVAIVGLFFVLGGVVSINNNKKIQENN